MSNPTTSLPPGFRFHPTDEELILHYLRKRAAAAPCPISIIAEVNIYKFDPWDLPAKAMFGDREWYFFSPRDRKYPNGVRPNRAAASGYWKATGTDKPIHTSSGNENIGVKKALVFYKGRPPKGLKTNWIMHEYRLSEAGNTNNYKPMTLRDHSMRLDDWVLCRIYKKGNNLQSIPPLMDQDQEDSGAEDVHLPTLQTITQENSLKLQKSSSISDFLEDYSALSHLFDNQLPEMPGLDNNALWANPGSKQLLINSSNDNGNGSNFSALRRLETECPASLDDNSTLKRQKTAEGYADVSKKRNDSCLVTNFSNKFDGSQYSFFNQQLLLNSHLGLQ